MTINLADNNPRISYSVAQGVTQQTFAVPFEFFNDSDLSVYVNGVLKVEGTDYTLTGGDGSTGNVVFVTATPPDVQQVTGATGGSTVVITRTTPIERTSDFSAGADINRAALNEQLDILTAMIADAKDRLDRSVSLNGYDAGVTLTLPVNRAGKVIAFDASGNLINGPTVSSVDTVSNASADIQLIADNIAAILDADNQATAAASSASAASSSASAAAGSASAAASSASTASASADAALAALDSFDDRYLGQKAIDPTLDNDGNALVAGALYFNTTDDVMKVYDGSVWVAAYASLSGTLIAANNLSDLASAAAALINLGLSATATELNYVDGVTSAIQTQLNTKAPTSSPSLTGTVTLNGTALTATAEELNKLAGTPAGLTATELGYVDGVTSAIQTQLDAKAPLNSPNFTGPIGVGGANYGASGQVLTSGGAGVAPAWANQVSGIKEFTASGAITAGDIVGVNTDGTVSKRGKTNDVQQKTYALTTTQRNVATSTQVLVPSSQYGIKNSGVISLSDTTFVSAHAFGSTCVARITTLAADGSATFGSDFTALTGLYGLDQIIKVSADKFAIFYRPTSTTTGVIIGQVSGSTITFGSPLTFQSGLAMTAFGLSNGGTSILVVGNVGGTNTPLRAYALSVSGTTVTAGGAVTLRSAAPSAQYPAIAYDSVNNVFIIIATMISSPYTIVSWAASISGTTLTTGSQQSIFGNEAAAYSAYIVYDAAAGRFICKNTNTATSGKEGYYSATVSSLVITASPVNDTFAYSTAFFILTTNGTLLRIDSSGNLYTISYDSANGYKPVFTALPYVSAIFATYSYIPIGTSGLYASIEAATNSSGFADAKVYTATFSDIASWIGSANETVSTGQSVDIAVSSGTGVGFSGLTAGTKYYITPLGTLVPESSTIDLAIFGTALSATTVLLNPTLT